MKCEVVIIIGLKLIVESLLWYKARTGPHFTLKEEKQIFLCRIQLFASLFWGSWSLLYICILDPLLCLCVPSNERQTVQIYYSLVRANNLFLCDNVLFLFTCYHFLWTSVEIWSVFNICCCLQVVSLNMAAFQPVDGTLSHCFNLNL